MISPKIRVVFLSRYQQLNNRGAERVVGDLVTYLNKNESFEAEILSGSDADNWSKVRGRCDVVIPTNGRWQALKMSWGRLVGGYKVIIIGHSGLGWDDMWNLGVARPNIFVGLTRSTLDNWRMKFTKWLAVGVQVVQIPNGVDLTEFNPKGRIAKLDLLRPIILSVGALVPEKGHDLVIEAISRLDKGSLLIIGDGPDGARLEKLAGIKLRGRFQICKIAPDQMPDFYRAVDLFALASWNREAFGVVYLEAMASGLAVVAPDDASRREIIGEAGMYVDVSNGERYAEAIQKSLETDWGDKPRRRVEDFGWVKVASRYASLISSVVGNKK